MRASIAHKIGYGLAVLALLLAAAVVVVIAWKLIAGMTGPLAAGLLTVVGTVGTAVWTFQRTKEKEIEGRLFVQKAAIYEDIVETLKLVVVPEEILGDLKPGQQQILLRLLNAKFKLITWGSPQTIRAMGAIGGDSAHDGDTLAKTGYLLGALRKDLGHKVTAQDCVEMICYMIKNEEQPSVRTLIMSSDYYAQIVKDFPKS